MEEEWGAPLIKNDCLLYSVDKDEAFHLTPLDGKDVRALNDGICLVKMEPDETSDYHGSSSGSPSSSLSSPSELKELGEYATPLHVQALQPPLIGLNSPGCSGSPFGMSYSMGLQCQSSPLPPVTHFSHTLRPEPMAPLAAAPRQFYDDGSMKERSPSPVTTSPSPDGSMSALDFYNVRLHALQVRSRSKMHEMAVSHKLITEQDPRGNGTVQLSTEERRTLVQEGYQIPTKLPLTKAEEEALKIVRRKIKNKLSAQESRRKRKEYMDTLEHRCQIYAAENAQLKAKLKALEAHMKKCANRV